MLKLKLLATAILVSVVSTAVSSQNAPGVIQPPRAPLYQVPPPKASAPISTSFWIKKEEFPPIFKLFRDTQDDESLVEVEAKVLEFMKESACKNHMVAIKVRDAQTRQEIIEEKPCVDFLLGDTALNKLGNFLAGEAVVVNNPGDLMINLVGGIIVNQLIAQFPNFEKEINETEQYFNWTHNVNTNGQYSTYGSVAYTKMPPALLAKNFDGTPKAGSIAELVVEGRMTLGCQVLGRKEQVSLVSLSDAFLELALPRVSKSVYANIPMLKKNIEREVRGKFVIKTGAAYLSYSVDFFGAPLGTNGFIYGPTRQTLTALYNLKGIYVFDDSKRQQVIDALNDMLRCR